MELYVSNIPVLIYEGTLGELDIDVVLRNLLAEYVSFKKKKKKKKKKKRTLS